MVNCGEQKRVDIYTMRPLLIDTNAYVAFKRGDPRILKVLATADKLFFSVTVLGELLAGFAAGTKEAKNRAELSKFLESPRVSVYPITELTADSYALIYASLRRKGQPIPTNDLWIAASALEHGAGVLTLDAHFKQIDGLRVGEAIEDFLP
jgi:tRNA(fMet)-specific endonuclease VapC